MAATVTGAFVILDRATPTLRKIKREAGKTDAAVRDLGRSLDSVGTNKQLQSFDRAGQQLRNLGRDIDDAGEKANRTRKRVEDLEKSASTRFRRIGSVVGALARPFKSVFGMFQRNVFQPVVRGLNDFRQAIQPLAPLLKGLAGGIGGVIGGLGGLLTAFPPIITIAAALTPVIIALAGAIAALAVSLAAAVGGGVLIGGGLLGAMAVGIGSIIAVAKPAISNLKEFNKATDNLNKALKSGDTTKIREAQKQVNKLAKDHPGIQKLASSLKGIKSQWDKLSKPAQGTFLNLAGNEINTLKDLLPTFAKAAQTSLRGVKKAFDQYLNPFFKSKGFRHMIGDLSKIFASNVTGFARGLTHLGKAFEHILTITSGTTGGVGGGFSKMMAHFEKWTIKPEGQKSIHNMVDALKAWLKLLGSIFKLFGKLISTMGVKGKKDGTSTILSWSKGIDKFTKTLTNKKVSDFFDKSLRKSGDFFKSLASFVKAVIPPLTAFGNVFSGIIKAVGPKGLEAMLAGFIGFKVAKGAVGGAKTGGGIVQKILGANPITGVRGAGVGSAANPIVVTQLGPGVPHEPGGRTPKTGISPRRAAKIGVAETVATHGPHGAPARAIPDRSPVGRITRSPLRVGATLAAGITGLSSAAAPGVKQTPGNKLNAFAHGADPTGILNYAGLPSVSDLILPHVKQTGVNPNDLRGVTNYMLNGSATIHAPRNAKQAAFASKRDPHPAQAYAKGQHPTRLSSKPEGFTIPQVLKNAPLLFGSLFSKKTIGKPAQQAGKDVKTGMTTAKVAIKGLHDDGSKNLQGLSGVFRTQTGAMKTSVTSLKTSVGTGLSSIFSQVQTALRQFGVGTSKVTAATPKKAKGGRIPGSPKGDTTPLFGRGGHLAAMVDGGEMILNRHQERRINRKLARQGTSVAGEVAGMQRNHTAPMTSHAKGGRVGGVYTASVYGGPGDPSSGVIGYMGDNLNQKPDSFAELNMGKALGGLPYGAPININYAGKGMTVRKRDIGAGGPGLGGHVRAVDLWYQAAQKIGFPGLANIMVGGAKGSGVDAGSGMPTVKTPKIVGPPGAGNQIGNAAMRRTSAKANKYMASKIPTASVGAGGLGEPGGGGTTMVDGHPVANWMVPGINWARSHGWGGTVSSGYRNAAQQMAAATNYGLQHYGPGGPLGSNHTRTAYPGGAIDVTDPAGMNRALAGYPGPRKLVWGGPVIGDQVHFSATGHQKGGRVPWYGKGTDFIAKRPQIIGVGDGGHERVQVTPKGGGSGASGQVGKYGVHIDRIVVQNHRSGDIKSQIKKEVAEAFDELARDLELSPVQDDEGVLT